MSQFFARFSIRTKVISAVGVVCALMLVLAAVAQSRMSAIDAEADSLYHDTLVQERLVSEVKSTLLEARLADSFVTLIGALGMSDRAAETEEARDASFAELEALVAEVGDEEIAAAYAEFEAANAELASFGMDRIAEAGTFYEEVVTPALEQIAVTIDARLAGIEEQAAASRDAAEAAADSGRTTVYVVAGLALALGAALALFVSRTMGRSAHHVVEVLEGVAAGDLTRRATVKGRDEFAALGTAVNATIERTADALRAIEANAGTLATSSDELSQVAQQVGASAAQTSSESGTAAAIAEQVSSNVGTVATAAAQMGTSIREIAGSAGEAASVADNAVHMAQTTTSTVVKLGESSAEIGEVIKVITSIAEQTNLLALNATIEAARAGEAGKGFAVVANEVKELAKQTSEATDDIATKVTAIQADAAAVATAIDQITDVIGQINDIQSSIAAAVEEQSVTTSEISRSVEEAALGAGDIAVNVAGVARATQDTSSGAEGALAAAQDLGRMAEDLRQLVSRFVLDREAVEV